MITFQGTVLKILHEPVDDQCYLQFVIQLTHVSNLFNIYAAKMFAIGLNCVTFKCYSKVFTLSLCYVREETRYEECI